MQWLLLPAWALQGSPLPVATTFSVPSATTPPRKPVSPASPGKLSAATPGGDVAENDGSKQPPRTPERSHSPDAPHRTDAPATVSNNLNVVIDGLDASALVDTGADYSVLSGRLSRRLRKVTTPWDGPQIRTAGGISSHQSGDAPLASRSTVLVFLNSLCGGAKPGLRDTARSPTDFFNTTATPNPVQDAWATLCRQLGSYATGGAVYKDAPNAFFLGHDTRKMERSPFLLLQASWRRPLSPEGDGEVESREVVGGIVVGGDPAHLASFIYEQQSSRQGLRYREGSSMALSEGVVHCLVVDYKVSVTPHRKLNTIQGVISENELLETSEEELVEGLASQGVVGARITLRRDGVKRKTRHIILTFNSTTLPETMKAGYLQCRVQPYVPNPQRCFKCLRFGHGSRNCRGRDTCAKCSTKEHATDACDNEPHCANCSGNHPAYSRSCPMWKDEKEVLKLKVTENISYVEAKKRFAFVSKGSYAEAVRRGPARPVVSMGTQTSPDDLHLPSRSPSKPPGAVPGAPPPNRKVNAALPASTPEQGTTSPAQPAASTSRGWGLPPPTSAPQRKPGEVPRQSTSRVQLPAAADEPMDEGGSRSDEEALLPRSESIPSASGDSNRKQNPSKKQSAPRVKIDFKP
ncbi:hypothetical protein ISCGN_011234 [Ixodes scapularis]